MYKSSISPRKLGPFTLYDDAMIKHTELAFRVFPDAGDSDADDYEDRLNLYWYYELVDKFVMKWWKK